ncbi:MAG: hypothetical protein K5768_00545 [Firmicutes bacterium]|nr:hypothetical protein [Bacillota bacterium]
MRKMFGKLTATVLSLMLVLGTVTLPVSAAGGVYTVSATGTTRIEGEDYVATTYPSPNTGALGNGGNGFTLMNIAENTSTKYTVSYTLNVSVAGSYSIKAAGSLKGNSNLSDWTIYANTTSNAPARYTAAGTTFRVNGIGAGGGDVYDCGKIHLNAGENTLYWSFGKASGRNSIWAALDYIELTAPSEIEISGTETTRIEGEDFFSSTHLGVNSAFVYSSVLGAMINVDDSTSNKYTVSYKLNVAAAGNYTIAAAGSLKGNSGLSDWTIYVNDTSNTPSSYTAAGTTFRVNGIGPNTGDVYNCGGTVYLAAGENTLYWKFGKATGMTKTRAALDYVELTPAFTVTTVSTTEATRIEGEDASSVIGGGYTRSSVTGCSGEKALSYSPVTWTDGTEYIAGYYLSVTEAGYYKIDAVASIRSQAYTSDWYIYANTSENTVSGYTQVEDVATSWYSGNIKKFNCGKIYLNEGTNTIYWKLNENDNPEGKMQAALDYIELTPVLVDIGGATVSDGTFTATVSKNRALPADANIYLAVYEDSGLNALKSIYVIDAGTSIGDVDISQVLSLSSGNVVRLYVWYDEIHTPLCAPTSVSY